MVPRQTPLHFPSRLLLALLLAYHLNFCSALEEDIFGADYGRIASGIAAFKEKDAFDEGYGRIVGGIDATPITAYPFYTFITVTREDDDGIVGTIACGGSLIHEDVVLSAAHCFMGNVSEVNVYVNRTQFSSLTGFEYFRSATDTYQMHPDFNPGDFGNDLAIIYFDRPVTRVIPLALNADPALPADGADVKVIGLGFVAEEGGFPETLQEVTLQVVNSDVCSAQNGNSGLDAALQLCAAAAGKDSCQGDSGGPMVVPNDDGGFVQVGVVSFGIGCARPVSWPCGMAVPCQF